MDTELAQIFQEAKPAAFTDAPAQLVIPDRKVPSHIAATRQKVAAVLAELPREKGEKREPESSERLSRTLFVGNVAVSVAKDRKSQRELCKRFEEHGKVESIRFRSLVGEMSMSKRVAYITGKTNEERLACNAFVVMSELDAATKAAIALNGVLFQNRHLRVDTANSADSKPATKKSIFVGNLPLNVDEESIWKIFESCGPISYVRVVRDKENGLGKGFGYVAFKDKAAIELALQLAGTECEGRPLRVSRCAKPGYQQVKKARKEKRTAVKESFKGLQSKNAKSKREAKATTITVTSEKMKSAPYITKTQVSEVTKSKFENAKESYLASKMPKLVARHKPEEKREEEAPRKLHPAEIRKQRKLKKGGELEGNIGKSSLDAKSFAKRPAPSKKTSVPKKAKVETKAQVKPGSYSKDRAKMGVRQSKGIVKPSFPSSKGPSKLPAQMTKTPRKATEKHVSKPAQTKHIKK